MAITILDQGKKGTQTNGEMHFCLVFKWLNITLYHHLKFFGNAETQQYLQNSHNYTYEHYHELTVKEQEDSQGHRMSLREKQIGQITGRSF